MIRIILPILLIMLYPNLVWGETPIVLMWEKTSDNVTTGYEVVVTDGKGNVVAKGHVPQRATPSISLNLGKGDYTLSVRSVAGNLHSEWTTIQYQNKKGDEINEGRNAK